LHEDLTAKLWPLTKTASGRGQSPGHRLHAAASPAGGTCRPG